MKTYKIIFEVKAENLTQAQAYALELVSKTNVDPTLIIDDVGKLQIWNRNKVIKHLSK